MALTFNSGQKSYVRPFFVGSIVKQKTIFCIKIETLYHDDVT